MANKKLQVTISSPLDSIDCVRSNNNNFYTNTEQVVDRVKLWFLKILFDNLYIINTDFYIFAT